MTIPLTIRQVEILVKTSESKGLSEAARLLDLSPSAISKGISALEENLGVKLIKRTTRNFQLTEAGKFFVDRSSELLNEFNEIINSTCEYINYPHGALKITSSVAFGYAHLVDVFDKYREQQKDVELILNLDDRVINLNENDIDIALRITSTPPQNYATRKLAEISWMYCASPTYLKRMGTPQKKDDLLKHNVLVYPGITPSLHFTESGMQRTCCNKKPKTPLSVNSSLLLLKATLANQGVAWLPSYLVSSHIENGELTPLIIDGKCTYPTHQLYALYIPSKYKNPKVRSFIDFLLEDHQPWKSWERITDNIKI